MRAPWYRDIQSAEIPEFTTLEGVKVRVIAGRSHGVDGAMQREVTDPLYLDLEIPAGASFTQAERHDITTVDSPRPRVAEHPRATGTAAADALDLYLQRVVRRCRERLFSSNHSRRSFLSSDLNPSVRSRGRGFKS